MTQDDLARSDLTTLPERLVGRERAELPVRLGGTEIAAIREVFELEVGPLGAARLWLFGSRADPAARGGDIDLYVEVDAEVDNPPALVRRLRRGLEDRLGERRIDIVIRHRGSAPSALHRLAKQEGIELWKGPTTCAGAISTSS